jgi:uncharacterized protein (UPF0147 family)
MDEKEMARLLEELIDYSRIPKSIRERIQESLDFLKTPNPMEEKVSMITGILDDAASDPNVSSSARTYIWSVMSLLEQGRG